MNENYIVPLLALGLFATLNYFRGRKKNAWISGWISRETEDVLKPEDTRYVNIGGTIGYNFVYKLQGPFKEAKGTFTLLPRHSALYLPLSLLITRHDKYYLQLFANGKLAGEGHIVAKSYFSKARHTITGSEEMNREEYSQDGRNFVLLWEGKGMDERLKKLLEKVRNVELLKHFCCYGQNRNFFVYARPKREKLGEFLDSLVPGLKPFYIKGGFPDGSRNEAED